MKRLNLGCGKKILKGYINLDKVPYEGVDVIWDLEKTPLPFDENSFDEILAYDVLEHIENLVPLMEDLYRILKPGGVLKITVPYYNSKGAFQDPTHKRFFTEETFLYFTNHPKLPDYQLKCKFKVKKLKLCYRVKIMEFFPEYLNKILRMLFCNLVKSIYVELEK